MWVYHGNSKCSNTYRYYRCTKRNDNECKNKTIPKDYIEDIVVKKCKSLLTDKNIEKISKKIYDTCQKENNSNVVIKNLEKKKTKINKNIENLMTALENGQHIDMITQRITQNENELAETQSQLLIEMAKVFQLKENEIKFFLTKLKACDNNIDDSYRKVLVDMLVNSIYVYDNELVLICNVGNKPITLTIDLIEDIKSELVTEPFTFVKRFRSPYKKAIEIIEISIVSMAFFICIYCNFTATHILRSLYFKILCYIKKEKYSLSRLNILYVVLQ